MIDKMYGTDAETPTRTEFDFCPSTVTVTSVDPVISNGAKQTIRLSCTEMSGAMYPSNDTLVAATWNGSRPVASSCAITVALGPRFCPVMAINSPGAI